MELTESTQQLLRCPICKSALALSDARVDCTNTQCQASFPIVSGVPVLINESSSVFSIADFVQQRSTTFRPASRLTRVATGVLPQLSANIGTRTNYAAFARLLKERSISPKVLVLGGSIVGVGMRDFLSDPAIAFVETDVALGPRTMLICDAHDIPFPDGIFDGVVVQAVLEHVADPYRCVEEIHRVLGENGLVYAETPFMQQVHMGRYDFTRFTHLGHRRLFRKFTEITSGAVAGPATALAWSYTYFLLSFVRSKTAILLIKAFTRLSLFWLKYFDYYLLEKPGTFDSASGYYFMGRKSEEILSDRELVKLYKGIL